MKRHQFGSVSVACLLIITVVMIASAGAVSYSYASMARAKSDAKASAAYSSAQAALELAMTKAFADLQVTKGSFLPRNDSYKDTLGDLADDCTSVGARVVPTPDPSTAWITATAVVNGRTESIRVFTKARDVGIWNNAIFAGSGATGQAINGNVDIRGSVHILGDGEPFLDLNGNTKWDKAESYTDANGNGIWDAGEPFVDTDGNGTWSQAEPYNDVNSNGVFDPPMTQTDLNSAFSGNSGVQNHYDGLDASLKMSIPPPPSINGVETLGAEVRVKNGMVGLSGNAAFGTNGLVNGGSAKSTIDGSYVSAGYTGSQGANSVYSDNGAKNGYDLGTLGISYPLIAGIGAPKYTDTGGTIWGSQEEFLDARSLTVPVTLVKSTTAAFSYGPDVHGNFMSFTPAGAGGVPPAKLVISGIVKVPDGFQLGVKDKLTYAGNGTLYCPGTMKIDGDIVPASGLVFPLTARMGFITKKDLLLATGSGSAQLNLAGAFYAQGKVVSAKQNQIVGTMVGSYYDLGTNVPSIYQVPGLSKNLPPGMPGDKIYIMIKNETWRVRHMNN